MSAEEMLKKLRYDKDEEPRFNSIISYTHHCIDGCCRLNDLVFYANCVEVNESYITYELLQAINTQIKELIEQDKINGETIDIQYDCECEE